MTYPIGYTWSEESFDEMRWNNNRLYGLFLPGRSHKFTLLLDYCLRNTMTNPNNKKWQLVPVQLTFENVINLKINTDHQNYTETDIVSISRENKKLTPNGKIFNWDYSIHLSPEGSISFTSTGFKQITLSAPILSETYDLDRELLLGFS
jgi:hypothetical protein